MRKLKLLLLAGNTLRARSYCQMLARFYADDLEIAGVFYGFQEKTCIPPDLNEPTESYIRENNLYAPDFRESPEATFRRMDWPYQVVDDVDVNGERLLALLRASNADVTVFAGYGGQLLRSGHFTDGRKYLHMHPGRLPVERGSTTFYYSILMQRPLSVTAFYMTEKIDAGEHVTIRQYPVPPHGADIDRWIDNVIRADCFKSAVHELIRGRSLERDHSPSHEYYVIHPVLKHCALLSLKSSSNDD